jgi:hypothetical protein
LFLHCASGAFCPRLQDEKGVINLESDTPHTQRFQGDIFNTWLAAGIFYSRPFSLQRPSRQPDHPKNPPQRQEGMGRAQQFRIQPRTSRTTRTEDEMNINNGGKQGRNQVNYAQFVRVVRAVRG